MYEVLEQLPDQQTRRAGRDIMDDDLQRMSRERLIDEGVYRSDVLDLIRFFFEGPSGLDASETRSRLTGGTAICR